MRLSKLVLGIGVAIISCGFVATSASAAHDPCKVLTAETFSRIMGYAALSVRTDPRKWRVFILALKIRADNSGL